MLNHEYEYSAQRDEDFYVGVPKGYRVRIVVIVYPNPKLGLFSTIH